VALEAPDEVLADLIEANFALKFVAFVDVDALVVVGVVLEARAAI
jgi:hypothetical protein